MKCKLCLVLALLLCALTGAQDFKWIKTLEIKGNGIMQGPPMDLRGSKWRVRYTSDDNSPILVELYNADGTSKKEIIRVNNKQSTSGTKVIDYKGGFDKGFLRISGSYNGWIVTFEQFVDDIKGWELTKLGKAPLKFDKFGIWSGDGGEIVELPINVQEKCWKLNMTSKAAGRLKVEVIDSHNTLVALAYFFTPSASDTWFFANGEYKLRINSVATPWVMEINTLK